MVSQSLLDELKVFWSNLENSSENFGEKDGLLNRSFAEFNNVVHLLKYPEELE
ncbi:MAG: hypothetical protein MHPSP_003163, partial [Paramarteilia canceri]